MSVADQLGKMSKEQMLDISDKKARCQFNFGLTLVNYNPLIFEKVCFDPIVEEALKTSLHKVKNIVASCMDGVYGRNKEELGNVNIYPVNSEACGKKIDNCGDIPVVLQKIPSDRIHKYSIDKDEYFKKEEYTALGLYRSDNNSKISQVFLFVDHIKESAKKYGCELKTMIIMVLLHELAHAAMDVFHDVKLNTVTNPNIKEGFCNFREESLANAIAYGLICSNGVPGEDKIKLFVENQPVAYKACLRYINDLDLLNRRTNEWIKMKTTDNLSFNDDMARRWVDTLLHGSDAELAELEDNFLKL